MRCTENTIISYQRKNFRVNLVLILFLKLFFFSNIYLISNKKVLIFYFSPLFSFIKREGNKIKKKPLVDFIAYCLNPNHHHFLITPLEDLGIEKFMQRLGNGYTKYFNNLLD